MTDNKSAFEHLAEIMRDAERAFHELGPVWGSPPWLCEARLPPGKAAYTALVALLDHAEARDCHAKQVRVILAACQMGTDQAIIPSAALFGLPADLLDHVLRVFTWVAATGGLSLDDFEDRGERYLRVVRRKRPNTIAKMIDEARA